MGGFLILLALTVSTLLWADLTNPYVWIVLLVTVGFGLIGFFDDFRKLTQRSHHGIPARGKLLASNTQLSRATLQQATTSSTSPVYMYNWVVDILPYVDQQQLYNAWNRDQPFNYAGATTNGTLNNLAIGNTALAIFGARTTTRPRTARGTWSYAVNGGFTLSPYDGGTWQVNGQTFAYGPAKINFSTTGPPPNGFGFATKLGMMFPSSDGKNAATGQSITYPWDYKTTPSAVFDGASVTLLVAENTLAGASPGSAPSGNTIPTNWACPIPQFCMFVGSSKICPSGDCTVSPFPLAPIQPAAGTQVDGPGWHNANLNGNGDNINFGTNLTDKGSSPFINSGHPGGFSAVFCDGSIRFLSATIDGTVYSKLLSPAGSKLPPSLFKQLPLAEDAF